MVKENYHMSSEPKFIEVLCTVCGKPKQLRIDNRTCSTECYKIRSKTRLREYNAVYWVKRKAKLRERAEYWKD